MRPRLLLVCLTATVPSFVLGESAVGQNPFTIKLDQVMTAEELRTTGVGSLQPRQRAALERWLTAYTERVVQLAAGSGAGQYAGVGSGHWIQKVSDGGRLVTLEDGSLWEINAIDRIYTMLWLPVTEITVLRARSPVGDYLYELLNTDDGKKALARYLARR